MTDSNLEALLNEVEPYIDKWFSDADGDHYQLMGILCRPDDYYYCCWDVKYQVNLLLSCVMDLKIHFKQDRYTWNHL